MRLLVMFDLPTITAQNKRDYRDFRKLLTTNGFYMMQESIYCRMATNQSTANYLADLLTKQKPSEGLVQLLMVTEKQFNNMKYICGSSTNNLIDSTEKVIIL